jgi:arabinofuranan 3-O-arabinosyltransferase
MRTEATSRLRMWGYCLALVAVAFVQQPGRIVGDTKFDLAEDPGGFLARAAQMWDPNAAFGQLQNQAYGYFWPMGPFFVLGHTLGLPAWVIQRLWWAALLCLAFVGTVKLARALGLGRPWAHVVSGFAFALSAHMLTLLGPTSVEAWPSAWAPWVLLPLVNASKDGSVRRGAALSALAVAMCGGVNATAVSAVLPLGVLWLLTRERGRVRVRLFGWWVLFTLLATLWWVVPLLLLGRYSVPFLDYIENAPITTVTTGLPDILGGTSDWVAYISPQDWVAGNLLGTTPFLLVNAAVIAGAGLAGIARRDNPERQFLFLGVLVGVVVIGFGYVGPLHGWWADGRLALLDAGLAPFRNLHKFDVVLRLSLVMGLAHFLTAMADSARTATTKVPQRVVVLATVVSVVGLAVPAYAGRLAPPGSFEAVPDYWRRTADYLAGASAGRALVVPASAFGDYRWGSPHDDVLQPLASTPWAVRNIIPLAQPGNVRLLDAVTGALEDGRPSPTLARFLAANGVGYLVVRNDLSPTRSGAPDPVVLHQALDGSPGLVRVARFGPTVGEPAVSYRTGVRILANRGRQAVYPAVEVYAVQSGPARRVSAWVAGSVPVVAGDPAAGLTYDERALAGPTILAGDRSAPFLGSPTVLTDGLRRREMAFTSVRDNESATLSPGQPWTLRSVVHNHRIYTDQERYETQVRWVGVASVRASSSQSNAATLPPIRRDRSPAEALDGAPWTRWVSADPLGAVGQWWRVRLERPTYLRSVSVRLGESPGPAVTRLRITTDAGSRVVPAAPPGRPVTYRLPAGPTRSLEIRAVAVDGGGPGGSFAIAEVRLPDVRTDWALATPDVFVRAPDQILLAREPDRPACAVVGGATTCDDLWERSGEQELTVRRLVRLRAAAEYDVRLTAVPRRGPRAAERLSRALPVQVQTSASLSRSIRASGLAAIDGDPGTAWVAAPGGTPSLRLRWESPTALDRISFDLARGVPGAMPRTVRLTAGDQTRTVRLVDGRGSFEPLVTDDVRIDFLTAERAYSFENAQAVELPVAVGEVSFPDSGVPVVDPDQPLDLGCRSGPKLTVNGEVGRSRLEGTLATVMSGKALPVTLCEPGPVVLESGANLVAAARSQVARPEQIALSRVGAVAASPQPVGARAGRWGSTARTVTLPARDVPTLLAVPENINAGWAAELAGRALTPQRVDGWMQGWVVPPGPAGQVQLRFTPNPAYHWALLSGLLALLVVAASAALPARRLRGAAGTGDASWLVVGAGLVAGGLVAGWVGFLALGAALLVGGALRRPGWLPYAAGASVAFGGVAQALARAEEFQVDSLRAQSLALLGIVLAAAAFGANGPAFFRRRKGRSRT